MTSEAAHDQELLRRVEDAFDVYVAQLFDGTVPDRDAYLAGVDADLRERVSELIDQYAEIRKRVDSGPRGFRVGREVDHYHLEREIGRGAMGIVYEAHDLVLDRAVAIKLLYPIYSMTEHVLERFRREASAGGRLSHRGIVQVHEIGEDEGTHFIALELVRGGSIEQYFATLRGRRHLPGDHSVRMARLLAETAEAVAVAHAAGVVHRDLKPANLLLTEEGNPKVADFGLAWIEDELSHTGTGVSTGTPFYMSPEQADPRIGKVGPHTDVFSLGVTLYEALTLERPFQGDTRQQVANKILHQDPVDPRRLRSRIPRDLAVICLKALEKNPADRYPTARELAADLRRFLADEPIVAKPPSKLSLALKWCRRHKAVTSAGAVLVIALLVVSSLLLSLRVSNRRNEKTLRHVIPLVRALDSPDQLEDEELRELLGFALDELESRPEHQLHWLGVLGRELARQGRYDAATPALERAWQVAERSGSTTGPERARLGADLARCLLQTGRFSEAEVFLRGLLVEQRDALEESERVELQGELLQALLDDEDPGTLSNFELEFGPPREILERLYALRSERAGNASPEALAALLLLADFHAGTGDAEAAAGLLEESQGSFYSALPSTHRLILEHRLRLAQAREALGQFDLARRMIDDLLERVRSRDAVLDELRTGELHVLAGRLNANEEGRYQKAIDAYRIAVDRTPEGALGVEARRGLGNSLLEFALVGSAPFNSPEPGALLLEAEARLQDALVLQRRDASNGPALETAILSDLAFVALVRGEYAHSADLHEFLLADRARLEALGGEDVYVTHLERAAFAQRGAGAPELALALQRSAWETARDELGARSDRALTALLHLARLTHELLDCDAAHVLVEAELAREVPDAELDAVWAEDLRAALQFEDGVAETAFAQWKGAWESGPRTIGSALEPRHLFALRGIGEFWASQESSEADFRRRLRHNGLWPLVESSNRLRPAHTWTRLETELLRISLSEVD